MNYLIIPGLRQTANMRRMKASVANDMASKIINVVCNFYSVSFEELKGNSRKRRLTHPRHVCMYLMVSQTYLSMKEIATTFCIKDHSTVIHAKETIKGLIEVDEVVRKEVIEIKDKL